MENIYRKIGEISLQKLYWSILLAPFIVGAMINLTYRVYSMWYYSNRPYSNAEQIEIYEQLKALDRLPVVEKRRSLVYISKDYDLFWNWLHYNCISSPFIIPAVSGIPLIGGLPDCFFEKNISTVGFSYYSQISPQSQENMPLSDLCKIAKEKGFDQIYVLEQDQNQLFTFSKNEC
ncbi:hypothetical protein L3556_15980 [Candidatus Synechococcus calcipolaris G9]|uniref:Uncharacterized protein n=1 Tax=Candidatus Synechococcus calcipolaris G9 TaxID=1497997 RepID=A0ABT6F3H3_9SYNE|nr:hypothetical protein [Candidatus Synechococcus calcipolaris]MDG2992418.1 hypothetical protein [Candidatus Synechococcus calcipolaris G9]